MTWEAFRLTSKSPAEVLHVLGPHGVDDLIRKMMDACWRESPEEGRSFESVRRLVQQVYDRNMRVWSRIKKPTPQAFFEDLLPHNADGFMRQALVLTWMMLPRAGGRDFSQVKKIVADVFARNMTAWAEDNRTFTGTAKARKAKTAPTKRKPAAKVKKRAVKKAKR
ncbi:MAG: hypothetical protein ACREIT_12045 [Tepidisphaeraceae bacterium]